MLLLRSTYGRSANILSASCKLPRIKALNASRYLSIKVAIVGSGPAGFYTAQKLLKNPNIDIDIFERLPVPFGLVRYGVAPDHRDVKNVIKSFTATVVDNKDRLNFYGNVNLGKDLSLDNLAEAYHAVVLCYGSAQDKLLNIEGENSKNTISARNFVGWYNGSPENKDLDIDLNCDTACIIGHGNVALDCARILFRPSNLEKTDITSYAQQVLAQSKLRRIFIIGRRGPIQVSFTIKELRELIKMNEMKTILDPPMVFEDAGVSPANLGRLKRHRRRMTELLMSLIGNKENTESKDMKIIFKFLSSPYRIKFDSVTGKVCGLELQKCRYDNIDAFIDDDARPSSTDEYETIDCGLIIRSIGYKAVMVDKNLPFNPQLGAILNTNGRIHGHGNLYCSGWLATGASGVIAGTLHSSQITSQSILEDIHNCKLPNIRRNKLGYKLIETILTKKSIRVVHFNDWLRIDEMERRLGALKGKEREKLVDIKEMLHVASAGKD